MIVIIIASLIVVLALAFIFSQVVGIKAAQQREDNEQLISSAAYMSGGFAASKLKEDEELKGYAKSLHRAGIKQSLTVWICLNAALTLLVAFALILIFKNVLFALFALLVPLLIHLLVVNRRIKKQKVLFEQQFGRACTQIAGSIRTGMSIDRAIRSVASYMDDPLRSEFMTVAAECAYDPDVAAALKRMAVRMESADAMLFASMIELNQRRGGKLADSVERLSETISTRQAMRRHVQAESSNGKTTGHVVLLLTIFIVVVMLGTNNTYLEFYISNPLGWVCLGVAGALFIAGAFIMSKMTDFNVE